jgi:hypothetical protein
MYRVLENPMSVWRRVPCPLRYLGYAVLLVTALGIAFVNVAKADTVNVSLDQAQIIRMPSGVATIVIGNPLIADASLQAGGLLVVTGKGFGTTNLVALDRSGRVVMDKEIQVSGPRTGDLVTVYKGIDRESYSCTPECAPRITLGDNPNYFGAVVGQAGTRNGQAAGAGAPAAR